MVKEDINKNAIQEEMFDETDNCVTQTFGNFRGALGRPRVCCRRRTTVGVSG